MNIFELFLNKASDKEIIKAIKKLKNINIKDEKGWTLLHYASSWGRFVITKYLIEHGADVNSENGYGRTPLYLACWYENFEIVKLLIGYGCDVKKEFEWHFHNNIIRQVRILTRSGACFL